MHMDVLPTCVSVHYMNIDMIEAREVIRSNLAEVTDNCELPCGWWN